MIITHDDVRRALGVASMDSRDIDQINNYLIPTAVGEASLILRRPIEVQTFTETHWLSDASGAPDGTAMIHFMRTPVTSVDAASHIDGVVLNAEHYRIESWGIRLVGIPWWSSLSQPRGLLTVTYTAGVGAGDVRWAGVRSVILARVARDWLGFRGVRTAEEANQLGVTQLSVEGYSVTYGTVGDSVRGSIENEAMGGFTNAQVRALRAARRPLVV